MAMMPQLLGTTKLPGLRFFFFKGVMPSIKVLVQSNVALYEFYGQRWPGRLQSAQQIVINRLFFVRFIFCPARISLGRRTNRVARRHQFCHVCYGAGLLNDTGIGPVLRWDGASQERPEHHDAILRSYWRDLFAVGAIRLYHCIWP